MIATRIFIRSIFIFLLVGCGSGSSPEQLEPAPPIQKASLPIVEFDNKIQRLSTFARVATSVEFYYPGDGAYETDWDKFIALGMYEIATTDSESEFVQTMSRLFEKVAPDVHFNNLNYQAPSYDTNQQVIAWHQNGYYDRIETKRSVFKSSGREIIAYQDLLDNETFADTTSYHFDYGNLTMDMPLILKVSSNRSLPSGAAFEDSEEWLLPEQLSNPYVCLASMTKIWAGVQNYWVYFDAISVDWEAELPVILASCSDENRDRGMGLFQKAITKLQDNHVLFLSQYSFFPKTHSIPIGFGWIEQKPIVVFLDDDSPQNVSIGDEITHIDGRDVHELIEEFKLYSRKSEAKRNDFTALLYLVRREEGEAVELTVRDKDSQIYTLNLNSNTPLGVHINGAIQAIVAEATVQHEVLRDSIHYVDLSITSEADIDSTIAQLSEANGIILDLRNYPQDWDGWRGMLSHFSTERISAAPLYYHWSVAPDRFHMVRQLITQYIQPQTPFIDVPVVALSSRFSQSQNEHALAYVQNAGIPILGAPTSGINGNVTNLHTFGGIDNDGMSFVFTGLEVTQNNHTPHIAVGILPDITVERTIDAIRNGEDNQLQAAIDYLLEQINPK